MTVRGRSGGPSPVGQVDSRALILIGAAVIIGLLLLARGFDSGATTISDGDVAAGSDDGGDTGATDAGTTETTAAPGTDGTDTATDAGTTETTLATDGATTDSTAPVAARDPSQIGTVLVANGSGTSGVAGAVVDRLLPFNYTADAANAPLTSASSILFRAGYSAEALALAVNLGAPQAIARELGAAETAPVAEDAQDRAATANIIVIVGSDGQIPTS